MTPISKMVLNFLNVYFVNSKLIFLCFKALLFSLYFFMYSKVIKTWFKYKNNSISRIFLFRATGYSVDNNSFPGTSSRYFEVSVLKIPFHFLRTEGKRAQSNLGFNLLKPADMIARHMKYE